MLSIAMRAQGTSCSITEIFHFFADRSRLPEIIASTITRSSLATAKGERVNCSRFSQSPSSFLEKFSFKIFKYSENFSLVSQLFAIDESLMETRVSTSHFRSFIICSRRASLILLVMLEWYCAPLISTTNPIWLSFPSVEYGISKAKSTRRSLLNFLLGTSTIDDKSRCGSKTWLIYALPWFGR